MQFPGRGRSAKCLIRPAKPRREMHFPAGPVSVIPVPEPSRRSHAVGCSSRSIKAPAQDASPGRSRSAGCSLLPAKPHRELQPPAARSAGCSLLLAKPRREMQYPDGAGQRNACPDWRSPAVKCSSRWGQSAGCLSRLAKPRREMQFPDGSGSAKCLNPTGEASA